VSERCANRVFVALGSNIHPEINLREAVRRLVSRCAVCALSPVYETVPVGKTDQPNFLNAAVLIETEQSAVAFKQEVLQAIESELGRVRTADKNAPRTIDLDITLFNEQVLEVDGRHIPDPDLLRYAHVAVPVADLAPGYRHPETDQTLRQIAEGLSHAGLRRRPDVLADPVTRQPWPAGRPGDQPVRPVGEE
jgi:2-amino-4-hydroxy-6-hydroxymethyldihydropteridine diphosphokinase